MGLITLKAGSLRSGCHDYQVRAVIQVTSCRVLTWWESWGILVGGEGGSLMRTPVPFTRAPPSHDRTTSQGPSPDITMLGARISTYEPGGWRWRSEPAAP